MAESTYNQITTGIVRRGPRYYLTAKFQNTDTGEERVDVSTSWFTSQNEAEQAAIDLAHQLQKRLDS
jgi:hypothetical protein